jgi:ParB family chromosome partitioning protein
MGKLDELRRAGSATAAESMGVGVPLLHGAPSIGPAQVPAHLQGVVKVKNVAQIPVEKIGPDPDQPREEFDEDALGRLAESLKARGQLQPIRVRWDEGRGLYMILVGERRWRAARKAGLPTLSAVIVEGAIEPGELLAIQLVENCLREDLRPIEQARAFRALMDRNGWSARQVARELAIDHTGVARALALLELPAPVQDQVEQGALAPATAYELSKVEDARAQRDLAERVVAEGMTRAETVEVVRQAVGGPKGRGETKPKAKGKPARLPAEIKHRGPGGCRVIIQTAARHTLADVVADLEAIAARLRAEMAPEMKSESQEAA